MVSKLTVAWVVVAIVIVAIAALAFSYLSMGQPRTAPPTTTIPPTNIYQNLSAHGQLNASQFAQMLSSNINSTGVNVSYGIYTNTTSANFGGDANFRSVINSTVNVQRLGSTLRVSSRIGRYSNVTRVYLSVANGSYSCSSVSNGPYVCAKAPSLNLFNYGLATIASGGTAGINSYIAFSGGVTNIIVGNATSFNGLQCTMVSYNIDFVASGAGNSTSTLTGSGSDCISGQYGAWVFQRVHGTIGVVSGSQANTFSFVSNMTATNMGSNVNGTAISTLPGPVSSSAQPA